MLKCHILEGSPETEAPKEVNLSGVAKVVVGTYISKVTGPLSTKLPAFETVLLFAGHYLASLFVSEGSDAPSFLDIAVIPQSTFRAALVASPDSRF